jgi:thymidylate synthase
MQFTTLVCVNGRGEVVPDNIEFNKYYSDLTSGQNVVIMSDDIARASYRNGQISVIVGMTRGIGFKHTDENTLIVFAEDIATALSWCEMARIRRVYCVGSATLYTTAIVHPLCERISIARVETGSGDRFPFRLLDGGVYTTRYDRVGGMMVEHHEFVNTEESAVLALIDKCRRMQSRIGRNPDVGYRSGFGAHLEFSLRDVRGSVLPLMTSKRIVWKSVFHELVWFLRGDNDLKYLHDNDVHIWDANANNRAGATVVCGTANGTDTRERGLGVGKFASGGASGVAGSKVTAGADIVGKFASANVATGADIVGKFASGGAGKFAGGVPTAAGECGAAAWPQGRVGASYGHQWRHFGAPVDAAGVRCGEGVDQIAALIDGLRNEPMSRRHVVSAWCPGSESVLPPCHVMFQMFVEPGGAPAGAAGRPLLSTMVTMRSSDLFLGLPFNIASYALLTHIIADMCGMQAHKLMFSLGDYHVYENQHAAIETLLARKPRRFPTVHLRNIPQNAHDLHKITTDCVSIYDYHPHKFIKCKMVV